MASPALIAQAVNRALRPIRGAVGSSSNAWYIDPQNGSDNNGGTSPENAFASMTPLESKLTHGDKVYLFGVLKQNWTSPPAVNDVTIVGRANTPRQATTSGTPNGGGATWMNPDEVASPLIHLGNTSTTLECQGWRFENIFFANAGNAPCVKLERKATGADPSHASFIGCKFTGADSGIQSIDGTGFLLIDGCVFFNFKGSGDAGIENVGTSVALPLNWTIRNSQFMNNHTHIVGALSSGQITGNMFSWKGSDTTTTVQINLNGGKNNIIMTNFFQLAHDVAGGDDMFTTGTDDAWLNYYSGGFTSAVPSTSD